LSGQQRWPLWHWLASLRFRVYGYVVSDAETQKNGAESLKISSEDALWEASRKKSTLSHKRAIGNIYVNEAWLRSSKDFRHALIASRIPNTCYKAAIFASFPIVEKQSPGMNFFTPVSAATSITFAIFEWARNSIAMTESWPRNDLTGEKLEKSLLKALTSYRKEDYEVVPLKTETPEFAISKALTREGLRIPDP
jgi:hypothetical protein